MDSESDDETVVADNETAEEEEDTDDDDTAPAITPVRETVREVREPARGRGPEARRSGRRRQLEGVGSMNKWRNAMSSRFIDDNAIIFLCMSSLWDHSVVSGNINKFHLKNEIIRKKR